LHDIDAVFDGVAGQSAVVLDDLAGARVRLQGELGRRVLDLATLLTEELELRQDRIEGLVELRRGPSGVRLVGYCGPLL